MHFNLPQMLLMFVLWTPAAWACACAYLHYWEGIRPGGRPKDGAVKKQIAWFALKTALMVGAAVALGER